MTWLTPLIGGITAAVVTTLAGCQVDSYLRASPNSDEEWHDTLSNLPVVTFRIEARHGAEAELILEPGDGPCEVVLMIGTDRATGGPQLFERVGGEERPLGLWAITETRDCSSTYLIPDPSVHHPFTGPTVRTYHFRGFRYPDRETVLVARWMEHVPSKAKPEPRKPGGPPPEVNP